MIFRDDSQSKEGNTEQKVGEHLTMTSNRRCNGKKQESEGADIKNWLKLVEVKMKDPPKHEIVPKIEKAEENEKEMSKIEYIEEESDDSNLFSLEEEENFEEEEIDLEDQDQELDEKDIIID